MDTSLTSSHFSENYNSKLFFFFCCCCCTAVASISSASGNFSYCWTLIKALRLIKKNVSILFTIAVFTMHKYFIHQGLADDTSLVHAFGLCTSPEKTNPVVSPNLTWLWTEMFLCKMSCRENWKFFFPEQCSSPSYWVINNNISIVSFSVLLSYVSGRTINLAASWTRKPNRKMFCQDKQIKSTFVNRPSHRKQPRKDG